MLFTENIVFGVIQLKIKNHANLQICVVLIIIKNFRDLARIQTWNLLSRNQVRYSVAPRGLFAGANISLFFKNTEVSF